MNGSKRLPRSLNNAGRVLCMLTAAALAGAVGPLAADDTGGTVMVMTVDGAIGPVTAEFILRNLERAEQEHAELLVIQLDTPGGLVSTTRDIIKGILASPVPVAVYVSPNGARAASAGTYILYAAHVAAMAPATTVGSATPVQMGGFPGMPDKPESEPAEKGQKNKNTKPEEETGQESSPDDKTAMERKIINDAASYIKSLAELRGRNAEWAETAVREAVNITAKEARDENVADLIAEDLDSLLKALNGRKVKVGEREQTLNTENAVIEYIEPDWRTEFLTVITDPNIFFILMLLAFYGLLYEFIHPGTFFPGIIGGISLLLFLYASQILPVNYAGLALIILGISLMVAEAFTPSFGILGVGGIIAFSVGSIILFNEEGYRISLTVIIGNAVISAVLLIWVLGMVLRIRRRPSVSGKETLVGSVAQAIDEFENEGYVWAMGENWKAVSNIPIQKGQKVTIKSVDGLVLRVEPVSK